MIFQAEILQGGQAQGTVLRLDAPISFWGGIDPETSKVTLAGHPQHGVAICDTILVLPQLIGSSSSSAVVLELLHQGMAPRALVLGEKDAILPIGVIVARQMGGAGIPVVFMNEPPFCTGEEVCLTDDGCIERL